DTITIGRYHHHWKMLSPLEDTITISNRLGRRSVGSIPAVSKSEFRVRGLKISDSRPFPPKNALNVYLRGKLS
ncbi:hypothetical protein AVEN_25620-1, partial [Araneus ventricosus]